MSGVFPSNIITDEKLPIINEHISKLEEMVREDDLLTQAGHPDPTRSKRVHDTLARLKLFKSVYFPGR